MDPTAGYNTPIPDAILTPDRVETRVGALEFYLATVNTPAMAWKLVGLGSQYTYAERDGDGNYLDGASTYRLTLPAGVPAKDFWSVVAYDPQTRSELQTPQPYPSRNSQRDALEVNADGSTDLWFGPAAPSGHESNWIATVPGKSWFAILRLYGPLEAWFDQTWRPGEFERLPNLRGVEAALSAHRRVRSGRRVPPERVERFGFRAPASVRGAPLPPSLRRSRPVRAMPARREGSAPRGAG